ncbi:hypothetical protein C8R44DRAFT_731453 [Mycena epipterygia]|nr:hypothetical protein C8R44DRAFT_731453 [Mycena epipterygia]
MSVDLFAFDLTNETSLVWSIAAVRPERSFSGAYLVIFGFYLHVLCTHGIAQHRFLAASTISLFILCTAHCALQLAITTVHVRFFMDSLDNTIINNSEVQISLTEAASEIYVTSNVIADSIFIFRCYAIWGSCRKIVILPIILTLAVAGLGYSNIKIDFETGLGGGGTVLFITSVATSLFTTFVLMGLTVGRIWWLARAARHTVGRKVVDRYYTVCAMILESGALYCIGGIAFLAVVLNSTGAYFDMMRSGAVLAQLVGIAPTIIAVRVGLGYSVENVDSFMAAPRTRLRPQFNPATPSVESLDDQVLHIHAEGVMVEGV